MRFQLPQNGTSADRFQRLADFVSQFRSDWPQSPTPATEDEIAWRKRRLEVLMGQSCEGGGFWPEEYQWFAENFGKTGCSFSFSRDISFFPISHEPRNPMWSSRPYLLIGEESFDWYYVAYAPAAEGTQPPLVWVDASDGHMCGRAADTLEQLLFSCAILNDAYYEYEWAIQCSIPPDAPYLADLKGDVSQLEGECGESLDHILANRFASSLREHPFQWAWFSTDTDQFWVWEDTCFHIARDYDPDHICEVAYGRIGSHSKEQADHLTSIMRASGFRCSRLYR